MGGNDGEDVRKGFVRYADWNWRELKEVVDWTLESDRRNVGVGSNVQCADRFSILKTQKRTGDNGEDDDSNKK